MSQNIYGNSLRLFCWCACACACTVHVWVVFWTTKKERSNERTTDRQRESERDAILNVRNVISSTESIFFHLVTHVNRLYAAQMISYTVRARKREREMQSSRWTDFKNRNGMDHHKWNGLFLVWLCFVSLIPFVWQFGRGNELRCHLAINYSVTIWA